MSEKVITTAYKRDAANMLIDAIANTQSRYYFFASKFEPYSSNSTIEVPEDSEDYKNQIYSKMVFGKRIGTTDVMPVVPRHTWTANTVYDAYDSQDDYLDEKEFYVSVESGAWHHVYKCLYNNDDSPSTSEPDFDSVSEGDKFFQTSDGYIWKYMYSVSDTTVDDFGSTTYFPVSSNSSVVSAAVNGSIDIIKVVSGGNGYSNYLSGNNSFVTAEMRMGGNNLIYNISGNSTASSANDHYNDCIMYIKNGPAEQVGQYKKIVDYTVNSTSKTVILESAFTNAISTSAIYEIYPGVQIESDRTQTVNAVARAIVNSVGNTVYRIDVLNSGEGYKTANAYVLAYTGIGVTNAELRVIASPQGGHGSDPENELGTTRIMLNVVFDGDESNTIPTSNDYRSVGILKDPEFANVNITFANSVGNFLNGETVYKISKLPMGTDGVTNSSSVTFTSAAGSFSTQFANGDSIYMVSGNNAMLATINVVTNSTSMTLTSNSSFTATSVSYYMPRKTTSAVVLSSNSTSINLTSVRGTYSTNDEIVAVSSGARMTANVVSMSGVAKGFDTFVSTYKYVGSTTSGTFVEDETIYQTSLSASNGIFHSIEDGFLYTTGSFETDKQVIGANSGATASLTTKYEPEIVFRSGNILYIENMDAIDRAAAQKETFKITFSF